MCDQIKYEVDKTGNLGQYLLISSMSDKENNFSLEDNRHTENGRIVKKIMRTMSLFERGESNSKVS